MFLDFGTCPRKLHGPSVDDSDECLRRLIDALGVRRRRKLVLLLRKIVLQVAGDRLALGVNGATESISGLMTDATLASDGGLEPLAAAGQAALGRGRVAPA